MAGKNFREAIGKDLFEIFDNNSGGDTHAAAEMIRISDIEPRKDQPRKTFDKEALELLADSISKYGVLQPIIVRTTLGRPGSYEIIAGERRWRAAKMAALLEIPAVVIDGDELKAAQVSIIENVQRENLNPVEEAMAYATLIDKFGLKQEEVAAQVGKSRSAIANMLRLLDLPQEVLDMLGEGVLTTGHARALLGLDDEDNVVSLAKKTVENNLSVREVENAVKKLNSISEEEAEAEIAAPSPYKMMARSYMRDLEHRSMEALGRKVRIMQTSRKKVVELSFDDSDDLEILLRTICGEEFFREDR